MYQPDFSSRNNSRPKTSSASSTKKSNDSLPEGLAAFPGLTLLTVDSSPMVTSKHHLEKSVTAAAEKKIPADQPEQHEPPKRGCSSHSHEIETGTTRKTASTKRQPPSTTSAAIETTTGEPRDSMLPLALICTS